MTLSPAVQSLIHQVRENEAERVLPPESALLICGYEGELAVISMNDEQLLSYALMIQTDLARRTIKALAEEQAVAKLREAMEPNREQRRRK